MPQEAVRLGRRILEEMVVLKLQSLMVARLGSRVLSFKLLDWGLLVFEDMLLLTTIL